MVILAYEKGSTITVDNSIIVFVGLCKSNCDYEGADTARPYEYAPSFPFRRFILLRGLLYMPQASGCILCRSTEILFAEQTWQQRIQWRTIRQKQAN